MPTAFGSDRCSGGSVVGVHAAKETENGRGFNQLAETFIARSISNATRRTYGETVKEFFAFVRNMQPTEVTSEHVIAYRDRLIGNRKSANTVALKLSIIRSFYEYLGAEGFSNRNPASTKLVSPPPVSDTPSGRALTPSEVRKTPRFAKIQNRSREQDFNRYELLPTIAPF